MEKKKTIASIGSMCQTKWKVCLMLKSHEYVHSPFDNVVNMTLYQFENILDLMQSNYTQLTTDTLKYHERIGSRIVDEQNALYKGYDYTGNELSKPFNLTHFFDTPNKDEFLENEQAWDRFNHKIDVFDHAIRDNDSVLTLVSIRRIDDDDNPFHRNYLIRSANRLMHYIQSLRTENFIIINLIEANVDTEIIEEQSEHLVSIVVPSKELKGTMYWQRPEKSRFLELTAQYAI